jgi:1-pyrroline-5-carboxylate dehydrogenase
MGDPEDFSNFMGAVIDDKAFARISRAIDQARKHKDAKILVGGESQGDKGWFIRPTVIEAFEPEFATMKDELFGPVLSIFVYEDQKFDKAMELCESTSPYGLTGAIFAQDRRVIQQMTDKLEYAAGNFYINDKPTGAVVGQQPFGGSRASGTNDKAGSRINLMRWTAVRTLKETFAPPRGHEYPFMSGNPRE